MNLLECRTAEQFNQEAKRVFLEEVNEAIEKDGRAVVAIPGGRAVQGLFRVLERQDMDWSKVIFFMVDERMVSLDDPDSNYRQAKELFLERTGAKAIPFNTEQGIAAYNDLLDKATLKERVFDLVVLSSGEDGHIAGIYPNHHTVKHRGKEYFEFDDSPKLPKHRMTASPEIITGSGAAILLFASNAKKKAYDNFQGNATTEEECPAKLVLKTKRPTVITHFGP